MVAHTYNPNTWEAEAKGSPLEASLSYIVIPCLKTQEQKQKERKERE
jgi:hypothetical protein